MLIGVLREARPGETRVAATPRTVGQLLKLGYEVVVEPGAGAAVELHRRGVRRGGRDDRRPVRRPTSSSASTRRRATQLDGLRDGRDAGQPAVPGAGPGPGRGPGAAADHGAGDGRGAADLPGAVAGRAVVDGEHRRLPRGGRGRPRLRPVLHRPGHRRRQGAAGQGAGRAAPASPAWRRSVRRAAWARSCAPPTRGPRSPTRCRSLGGEYLSVEARRRRGVAPPATPRRCREDYNAASRGAVRRAVPRTSTSSSPPR